ncbi:MAG: hypothetical protein PHV95_10950 [Eubacteriales bacterium]|nr:hypothetical protein [Eubacteriales bacterium]
MTIVGKLNFYITIVPNRNNPVKLVIVIFDVEAVAEGGSGNLTVEIVVCIAGKIAPSG